MLKDSIHIVPVVDFFAFRKNAAIFLCNGGVFEQSLGQKFAHLYTMIGAKQAPEDVLKYLKSLYVSEMIEQKGESFVWLALQAIYDGDIKAAYTVPQAIEELKRVSLLYQQELETLFPSEFSDDKARSVQRYSKLKKGYQDYASELLNDENATLEKLHELLLKQISYININPSERDSFEAVFSSSFTRWHQALGWKSASSMQGVTAFEFLTANAETIKKQVKK